MKYNVLLTDADVYICDAHGGVRRDGALKDDDVSKYVGSGLVARHRELRVGSHRAAVLTTLDQAARVQRLAHFRRVDADPDDDVLEFPR